MKWTRERRCTSWRRPLSSSPHREHLCRWTLMEPACPAIGICASPTKPGKCCAVKPQCRVLCPLLLDRNVCWPLLGEDPRDHSRRNRESHSADRRGRCDHGSTEQPLQILKR